MLVDMVTYDFGKVTAIAKGIKRKKAPINIGQVKLFSPLMASWTGRGELKTITQLEDAGAEVLLQGKQIFCGMYINELLTKLLQPLDPTINIYEAYETLLLQIQGSSDYELPLRKFEMILLNELGYGIDFEHDNVNGDRIVSDKYYIFRADSGFSYIELPPGNRQATNIFSGVEIQIIANQYEQSSLYKPAAKRLMRIALNERLGGRPIKSRQLFSTNPPTSTNHRTKARSI